MSDSNSHGGRDVKNQKSIYISATVETCRKRKGLCGEFRPTNLSHLLLALLLGLLGVGVVVGLYGDEVGGLRVDDEPSWSVLQRPRHLVEHRAKLFQRQNPVRRKILVLFRRKMKHARIHVQHVLPCRTVQILHPEDFGS